MKHVLLLGLTVVGVMLASMGTASADEKNVITLKGQTIVGNPHRPLAVIEVNKTRMQLGATTPTLASVTKIHDAAKKDPF